VGFAVKSASCAMVVLGFSWSISAIALANPEIPPEEIPEEIPEEVLQLSIIEQAHSQQSGVAQSPAEQAAEERSLRVTAEEVPAQIDPDIQQIIVLLRIRKLLKTFIPLF
jgi:hypothetical protein